MSGWLPWALVAWWWGWPGMLVLAGICVAAAVAMLALEISGR